MDTVSPRCLRLSILSMALILCTAAPGAVNAQAVNAQEEQERPFIEPVETHQHGTKLLATVEAHPAQNGRWDTLPFRYADQSRAHGPDAQRKGADRFGLRQ